MNGLLGESPGPFSPRTKRVTLALLLAGALTLCLLILQPFLLALLSAVAMAVVFYPLHDWMQQKIRLRSVAALISTALVLFLFLGPLTLIVTVVTGQVRDALQQMAPGTVASTASQFLQSLQPVLENIASRLGTTVEELLRTAVGKLQQAGSALAGQGFSALSAATGGVVKTFFAIGALFVLFRNGSLIYRSILSWSPLGSRYTRTLMDAAQNMLLASFYGIVAVAAAQGLICGIGVWIAGLPSPVLWGFAAGVLSILPLFGAALVWLPAAGVLFAQGSVGWGLFMLAWGAGLVSTIDNVVRPLVVMARLPMNPLVIFVAILGGIQAFGLIGILLGPMTLAVTVALFGILREEMQSERQPAPEDSLRP